MTSGDSLERIHRETNAEGAKMLARQKSRKAHDAYLAEVEVRLAALGYTWMDLLTLGRDEGRSGEGGRPLASGED